MAVESNRVSSSLGAPDALADEFDAYTSARVHEVLDVIMAVAAGDYTCSCPLSPRNDPFDAIAVGVNLMIDDLRYNVGVLERAYADAKATAASLEKAHAELKEVTAQLIQAEKLSALGELTAGIAHEMSQPLNGIKIISQSLLRDLARNALVPDQLPTDLTEVVAQVNKLAEIIDHMRIYTRLSDQESTEILDLNGVAQGSLRIQRAQLRSRGVQLTESYAEGALLVKGNAIRLEQVVVNLISNAVRAVEAGPDPSRKVWLRTLALPEERLVLLQVGDNGPGIREEIRNRVFQPFFTTRAPGQGTGLGLSVSRKIVEEHGGQLDFTTEVGKGTVFTMALPMTEGEP